MRALKARADELAARLSEQVGFTEEEALRFLSAAGPALMRSYEWQASELAARGLSAPDSVRDLLAGVRGRTLGRTLGMSQARTWAGLRLLVQTVMLDLAAHGDEPGEDVRDVRRIGDMDTPRPASPSFDLGLRPRRRRIERDADNDSRPGWARRGYPLGTQPAPGRFPHLAE